MIARLFELAPEVRPLFKPDIDPQAKKFSDMLAWVRTATWKETAMENGLSRLVNALTGFGYTNVASASLPL